MGEIKECQVLSFGVREADRFYQKLLRLGINQNTLPIHASDKFCTELIRLAYDSGCEPSECFLLLSEQQRQSFIAGARELLEQRLQYYREPIYFEREYRHEWV